jgi:hypothetical protein
MENTLSASDERDVEAAIGATRQLESGVEHVFFDRITRIPSR